MNLPPLVVDVTMAMGNSCASANFSRTMDEDGLRICAHSSIVMDESHVMGNSDALEFLNEVGWQISAH